MQIQIDNLILMIFLSQKITTTNFMITICNKMNIWINNRNKIKKLEDPKNIWRGIVTLSLRMIKIHSSNHIIILKVKIIIEISQGNFRIQTSTRSNPFSKNKSILHIIIKKIKVMNPIIRKVKIELIIIMKKTSIESILILLMICQLNQCNKTNLRKSK